MMTNNRPILRKDARLNGIKDARNAASLFVLLVLTAFAALALWAFESNTSHSARMSEHDVTSEKVSVSTNARAAVSRGG